MSISRALTAAKEQLERWSGGTRQEGKMSDGIDGPATGGDKSDWKTQLEGKVKKEIEDAGGQVEYVQVSRRRSFRGTHYEGLETLLWLVHSESACVVTQIVSYDTLQALQELTDPAVITVAARFGSVRLIDNMELVKKD